MNRRILSLILSLAMVLTCFAGMMTVPSYADSYSTQYVNTAAELKAALESGNRIIVLNKDIKETLTPAPERVWATTRGSVVLDLNGHTLGPKFNDAFTSTLIEVSEDSTLVICSSKSGGHITYNADIPGSGDIKHRNIISVFGTLIVNSGNIEAGRSTKDYSAYYAKYIYRQTYGTAITMGGYAKVVLNGGYFAGRGYQVPVIDASAAIKGSQLIVNNGTFTGYGSANVFRTNSLVKVTVRALEASCEKLDAVKIDGKTSKGHDRGHVGLSTSYIDLKEADFSFKGSSLNQSYYAKVTPLGECSDKWTVNNNAPRGMYLTLERDHAIVTADYNETNCYWAKPDFSCGDQSNYGKSHRMLYTWTLSQNGQFIASKDVVSMSDANGKFLNSINVEKDFGVFLETGQCFQLSCACYEYMAGAVHKANSYEYSIIVVTDLDAPVITENPMTNVIYSEGQVVTIAGKAEGTHVLYKWQYFEPGETVAKDLYIDGKLVDTPVLELKNLTKADSGKSYRLEAHNSAGNAYSTTATIIARNATIYPQITDLDAPMHGIPLDMTASTPSVGCKVTKVSWHVVSGDALDSSYVPYAGQTLICEVTVEAEEGFNLSTAEIKAWNKKNFSTSIPTVTSRCYSFMVDVAAPQGGVHIDSLKLQGLGDPSPEKNLTAATEIETVFGDTFASDVRYSVFGGSTWYCNDQKVQIPFLENFEVGSFYRLEVTITPQNGYYVDVDTIVTIDDQPMEVRPSGGKIIASIEYPMIEEKTMPFSDVPLGSYYYDAVLWAYYAEPQITDGMSDTIFGTGKTCTRGQVVTFLWRTAGCPEPKSLNNPFTDVQSSDYFYKPVLWAVEQGITDGTAPDKFSPKNPCKNSHILTFIWRAVGKPEDNGNTVWYQDAYNWANKNGLLSGTYTGTYDVNAACPRENVVTYLYRYNKL